MPSLRFSTLLAACATSLAFTAAGCGGSYDDEVPLAFSTRLTGAEAVPPNASAGIGYGLVTVDPDLRAATASVILSGVADVDAHVHEAPTGTIGPVVFPLTKAPGTTLWTARVPLSNPQFIALRSGNYYFDVHSAALPAGEIRGQVAWTMPTFEHLTRLQEVRQQSTAVELQLRQIQEIEDADDWRFSGVGLGLTLGF